MGAVQLDAVESDPLGGRGGLGERADDGVQVAPGHRPARALGAVQPDPGGADGGGVGERRVALLAHHADVPELRHDGAARRVDVLGDAGPPVQLLLAVEARDVVALPGGLVADVRPLGDDQADARGGAAGVVRAHVLPGHAARGELAGHRGHDDAVGHGQPVDRDGPGQDPGRAGGGRVGGLGGRVGLGDGHGDSSRISVMCAGTETVARANHLDGPRISPTARTPL